MAPRVNWKRGWVRWILLWGMAHQGGAWADPFSRGEPAKEKPGKAAIVAPVSVEIPLPLPWKETPAWKPGREISPPAGFLSENETQLWLQGIYGWLCGQQNPLTGLVESFEGSSDLFLANQAATYDQAIAGMTFLLLGDPARAKKILDFYAARWAGKGFCNFYSTVNGRVGLEWRRHVGPNMWLALLAYQYQHFTGDAAYLPMAEGLCEWVASLPHYNGGVAMSDRSELEIPWKEIVSTENVIDAIAVFQIAEAVADDFRKKQWLRQELDELRRFIRTTAVQPEGFLARGFRPFIDGVDKTCALDTTTWLIAASLPENLHSEYGVTLEPLLQFAEAHFRVNANGAEGYDFTDEGEAAQAGRPRMISVEWSAEMALAYALASQSASALPNQQEKYRRKWREILQQIDRFQQNHDEKVCYPYASSPGELTFANGWRTPKARPSGELAGSVAGTCWRLFAAGWNPLRLDSASPFSNVSLQKIPYRETTAKEKDGAELLPSSLTSEGLTTAAWLNLKAGRKKEAREYAARCIHLYSRAAADQQLRKASDGGLIPCSVVTEETKEKVFAYAALNDVAACWFILSQIDPAILPKASQTVRQKLSLAQVWDPVGKFWTVADALQEVRR